jgi:small subunit ribosomal protein S27e
MNLDFAQVVSSCVFVVLHQLMDEGDLWLKAFCLIYDRNINIMPLAKDLLHPSMEEERRKHKKKRLVQSPNSYFMDVKCPGCYKITTVFSHAQTVVLCVGCNYVLCSPSGGKARLTEGCSFRKKRDTPLARKDDTDRN